MKNLFLLLISIAYVVFIVYYQSLQRLPLWCLYLLMGSNALSILFYGMDKLAAIKHWRRTPEKHFYILALCMGWPGSIVGQIIFNHKTSKAPFRRWFYMMSILNITLVVYSLIDG